LEEAQRDRGFFFANAYRSINAIFKRIESDFPGLRGGIAEDKSPSFGKYLFPYLQQRENESIRQRAIITGRNANNEVKHLTIYEYFFHLDDAIKQAKQLEIQKKK
jgi:hypothetical protein